MDREINSLVAESRRIDRAVAVRSALLKKLLPKKGEKNFDETRKKLRPQRYSVEMSWVPGDLQPKNDAFAVDSALFRCTSIETSFRITGQAAVKQSVSPLVTAAGQITSITLPYGISSTAAGSIVYRQDFFDFLWGIRDNGQDRGFQNIPQPSVFLASGSLGPMFLPVPGYLVGGSEVRVDIYPTVCLESADTGIFKNVTAYTLHVSFNGYEVLK